MKKGGKKSCHHCIDKKIVFYILLTMWMAFVLYGKGSVLGTGLVKTASAKEIIAKGYCSSEDNWKKVKWKLYKNGDLVVYGKGKMTDAGDLDGDSPNPPSAVSPWYKYRKQIKRAVFKEGVTLVGVKAFYGCINMEEIQWNSTIWAIEYEAFCKCRSLKKVELPPSVLWVSDDAFSHCSSLEKLHLPNTVKYWGDWVFFHCDKLKEVTMDEEMDLFTYQWSDDTEAGGYSMFACCGALKKIHFCQGITAIPDEFFYQCPLLSDIEIPETVTYLGSCPAYGKKVYKVPKQVEILGYGACCQNKTLERIILPENLKSVRRSAFWGCKNLKEISFPENTTNLGSSLFEGCTSLETVEIKAPLRYLNPYVFANCNHLKNLIIHSADLKNGNAFDKIRTTKTIHIYVPAEKLADYKKLFSQRKNKKVQLKWHSLDELQA